MNTALRESAILRPTTWCVVRKQKQQYLIYNSRTDEMHLVPPSGFYVYQLCDGLRNVENICRHLTAAMEESHEVVRAKLDDFLNMLLTRGVLEPDDE